MLSKHQGTVLILVFICLTVGLISAGAIAYRNFEQRFRLEVERGLSSVAELKIKEIILWRNERLADGRIFFQNESISRQIQAVLENPTDKENHLILEEWLEHMQAAVDYDKAYLLDRRAGLVLGYPEDEGTIDSVIQKRLADDRSADIVHLLDFYRNPNDRRIYMAVVIPIMDPDYPERRIASLVFRIDPKKYLYPYINTWPSPSRTAETLIVRREKGEVVFLNSLRFNPAAALSLRFPLHNENLPAAIAARGYRGIVEGLDYRGAEVIAYVGSIPDSPWYIVARMDTKEVYAPLRERVVGIVLLVGVLILCCGIFLFYLWRQRVALTYREKYEAAEILRKSEEKFTKAFRSNLVSMTITDESDRFIEFNDAFCEFIEYSREEISGRSPLEIGIFTEAEPILAIRRVMERDERAHNIVLKYQTKSGEIRFGLASIEYIDLQSTAHWLTIITDITGLKQAEARVKKLNRVLSVLSDINQSIVRIHDENLLFERACSTAVEKGAFQLAWIGILDPSEKKLKCAACDGNPPTLPGEFINAWREKPADWGEFLETFRQSGSFISNDLMNEKRKIPWRFEALRFGLCSVAFYCLIVKNAVRGVIALYSSEAAFFDEEEEKLLEEMALDISFAIEFMDQEKEHRKAEEALAGSELRYRTVADFTYDWEYWIAPDGHFEYVSPSCERISGYSSAEFIDNPKLLAAIVDPQDREAFENHSALARTDPLEYKVHNVDFRIKHKDGTVRWLGHTCQSIYAPDESPLGIRATNRDITERKIAEEALQALNVELEERVEKRTAELSDLYNNAPCGYHSLDQNGYFVRINDTELKWFGYSREEVLGKIKFTDIATPESVDIFKMNFPTFLQRGWINDLEFDVICKDGSQFSVLVSGTAIYNERGEYVMSRSTLTDNTERKRINLEIRSMADELARRVNEVEASNKELEAFAYSISHDLRAPLRAIDGYSNIILEDKAEQLDEEGKGLFIHIRTNAQKMDRLIQDLLSLSRVNRIQINPIEVDMQALASMVYLETASAEVQKTATFIASGMPSAYCDPTLIRQVWTNLLSNAVKFTRNKAGSSIEVGGKDDEGFHVYYVKDDGVGFDPKYAEKLFGVFQRYHKAQDYEGSGVGLAIVERIVRRHGGQVWAEGAVDQGATFFFSLPKDEAKFPASTTLPE